MAKAVTGIDLARKLCAEHPDAPSRQLGRMLYKENVERFPNLDAAYQSIRKARGNQGERNRVLCKKTKERRPNGVLGWKPKCPPSLAEPWTPFDLGTGIRVANLSDIHVPYHSQKAVESAVNYCIKKFRPTHWLFNGDIIDFFSVSRWDKDPKNRDLVTEIDTTEELFSWICGRSKGTRKILKKGNHEERWDHYLWNKAPEIWGLNDVQLQSILHLDKYGIEVVGDHRPVLAGSLPIFHGHELGRNGIANPVNPARSAFLRAHHTILVGHSHQTSGHADTNLWHDETFCWSTGCLCSLTPDYARINRWNHGFAVIDVASDGSFDVKNLRISKDGDVRTS